MAFKPYCERCKTWHTGEEGHTAGYAPTPWAIQSHTGTNNAGVYDDDGRCLAFSISRLLADKIVGSVNAHDFLISEMKRAANMLPPNAACGVLRAAIRKVEG